MALPFLSIACCDFPFFRYIQSMGIKIYFSHHMETLAGELADRLQVAQQSRNPFHTSTVIVPNANIKRWLQLEMSDRLGIVANVEFPVMQHGLWQCLAALLPSATEIRPLRFDLLRQQILALILGQTQETSLGEALDMLTFMLHDDDGRPGRNYAARLWQISGQLARYFGEYEYHRRGMVKSWLFDEPSPDAGRMEVCQRSLYRSLFAHEGLQAGLAQAHDESYMTLPQFADHVLAQANVPATLTDLHVFAFSQVSNFHRDLLLRMGRFYELHIYQLNVCGEFWEDVSTDREDRWMRLRGLAVDRGADGAEELPWDENENSLLKWWGKPGRESVRLFSELEEQAAGDLPIETSWYDTSNDSPATVLSTVQKQILQRTQLQEEACLPQDQSLQVFAAPGLFREVESIHQSIICNLESDPGLKQSDIQILVPDIKLYKPIIQAQFEQYPRAIGYNLTDSNAARDSVYGQAVLAMLDLASSAFSRREVFDLILNPCFLAGRRIAREDALVWVKWADELQVFHSFDEDHREARGLPTNSHYTWQQGLRRLRLGRLMTSPAADDENPRHFEGIVPYQDLDTGNAQLVGNFSATIELLYQRLQRLGGASMSCDEWYSELEDLMDAFLDIPSERPEEGYVRRQLLEDLRGYSLLDTMLVESGAAASIRFDLIGQMIAGSLESIPSRHGSYLSGGVTISEIRPNRAVPFKLTYIAGMTEGRFPGSPDLSTLDLRRPGRRLGDVSIPEQNRYCILEALMCTRQKLYVSYISKDLQKDQEFYPCSVLVQLKTYLERSVLDKELRVAEVPVSGSSPEYLDGTTEERSDVMVNYSPVDRLLCYQGLLAEDELRDTDREQIEQLMVRHLRQTDFSLPDECRKEDNLQAVRVQDLKDFLLNPVEAALRLRLRVFESDSQPADLTLLEDEPFYSDRRLARTITDRVLRVCIRRHARGESGVLSKSVFDDVLEELYEDFKRRSQTPDGVFSKLDRHEIMQNIERRMRGAGGRKRGIRHVLNSLENAAFLDRVCIGEPDKPGASDTVFAPTELTAGDQTVEINGAIPLMWRDSDSGVCSILHLTHDRSFQRKFPAPRELLTPYLFYLVGVAGDEGVGQALFGDRRFEIYWANEFGVTTFCYKFKPDRAREYLQMLCSELTGPSTFDLLPYDVCVRLTGSFTDLPIPMRGGSSADDRQKMQYYRRLEREVRDELENPWSRWYHSPLLSLIDGSVPKDAWDKINQRFAPFYENF